MEMPGPHFFRSLESLVRVIPFWVAEFIVGPCNSAITLRPLCTATKIPFMYSFSGEYLFRIFGIGSLQCAKQLDMTGELLAQQI